MADLERSSGLRSPAALVLQWCSISEERRREDSEGPQTPLATPRHAAPRRVTHSSSRSAVLQTLRFLSVLWVESGTSKLAGAAQTSTMKVQVEPKKRFHLWAQVARWNLSLSG